MPRLRVEAGGRLVEQQDLGPVDQRAGDGQPALHAAGEVLDLGARLLGELDELQQLVAPLADLRAREPEVAAVDVEVVAHGELGVEGVLLRAHADPGPDPRAVGRRVEAEDAQLTASSPGETAAIIRIVLDLPAPLGPRKPNASPAAYVDVDAAHRLDRLPPCCRTTCAGRRPGSSTRGSTLERLWSRATTLVPGADRFIRLSPTAPSRTVRPQASPKVPCRCRRAGCSGAPVQRGDPHVVRRCLRGADDAQSGRGKRSRPENALVVAPTGSGKTLSAFLWAIDGLATEPVPEPKKRRCRVLYVSPLKALASMSSEICGPPWAASDRPPSGSGSRRPRSRSACARATRLRRSGARS